MDKLSLIGIGMKHELLIRFAEKFQLPSTSTKQEQAKYLGSKEFSTLIIKNFINLIIILS